MPSIDQMQYQQLSEDTADIPVEDNDIELLVRMGIKLLKEAGGLETIKQALDTSSDPGQVVGQFMAQLIAKLAEELGPKMELDPRAFLAKGGFLEELLDYIEEQLGLPSEFSDQVYSEAVEVIKAAAMDPEPGAVQGGGVQGMQQGQPQPQQQQVPPPPGPQPMMGGM